MIREIKFRAWDKKTKKMSENFNPFKDVTTSQDDAWVSWTSYGDYDKWDLGTDNKFEIMQFTGLKDKNEIEIYEGDIVKWSSSTKHDEINTIGEVHYEGVVLCIGTGQRVSEHGHYPETLEVIGNKYENPELLKGES